MKGQISLDFIFAIVLAILVGSTFLYLLTGIIDSQEKIAIHEELQRTALDISTTALTSQSLKDTNFYLEIALTSINYKQKVGYPQVRFDTNMLIVSETLTGETLSAQELTYLPSVIIVEMNQTKNSVVIRHA